MTKLKTALITGASSGIGEGIVRVLCEAGLTVHALARRAEKLSALAKETECKAHAADVTDQDAMAGVLDVVRPEILVLNAGRGAGFDGIANSSPKDISSTVATNVEATLMLLHLALPGMIERGRGHIVTMGSVAALYPSPSALYGGTKAAVKQIAENLRLELCGTGIRVTDIRPGRVTSEFYDTAVDDPDKAAAAKNTGIRELSPIDIGNAVRFAVMAPPHVNVSTIEVQPLEQTYGGLKIDPVAAISGNS
ncbi:MAG: SDR family oxidoreductase [Pseudomonadota bacterium]